MPIDPREDSALSLGGDTGGRRGGGGGGGGRRVQDGRAGGEGEENGGGGNYLSRKSIFAVAAALPTGIPNLILFDVTIRARLLLNNDDVPGESPRASGRANAINRRLAFVFPLFSSPSPPAFQLFPRRSIPRRHCKDNSLSPPPPLPLPAHPPGTREIDGSRNRVYARRRGYAILAKLRNVP